MAAKQAPLNKIELFPTHTVPLKTEASKIKWKAISTSLITVELCQRCRIYSINVSIKLSSIKNSRCSIFLQKRPDNSQWQEVNLVEASENEIFFCKRDAQTNPPEVGTVLRTESGNAHSFGTVMQCISKSLSKTDDRSVCHVQAKIVANVEVF